MSAPDNCAVQINIKTPSGALLNIYATNVAEAQEIVEAVQENLVAPVAALEQALHGATTVAQGLPLAPAAQQPSPPPARPLPATPQPPAGNVLCDHGLPAKIVPGGISKTTGQPYGAFYACPMDRGQQCKPKFPRIPA
jgi:hypothetical protein